MKKYLMTWYGVTDFRASLGFEKTTGPVFGALLAEEYSDICLLGYTKPNDSTQTDSREKGCFSSKLSEIKNASSETSPVVVWQFIDDFLNTEEAHEHFTQWLKKKLQELGKKTKVNFQPVCLQHLNDTEGIYEAATKSLDSVSSQEGEKLATLYLSPGTPVMAFTWAFAALRHPNLKKRLIASSLANKPPETIVLPDEWLEWHGKQVKRPASNSEEYDIIFHLFGEQRIPSLLGVLQFSSKMHVFVNSKHFPAEVMRQFIGDSVFGEISVDPYDPENVRTTILDILAKAPSDVRVGFNLTGGTKLMYAGALAACRKINATPFYFNGQNDKVIFLNDFKTVGTKNVPSVETFINLNGDNLYVSKSGFWNERSGIDSANRQKLTFELWRARSKISKLYWELSGYNESFEPFNIRKGDISAKLTKDADAEICIGDKKFRFKGWKDFAQYLIGGWFEEYTYLRLKPFVDEGLITDLRIGLEVAIKEENSSKGSLKQLRSLFGNPYQELDVVFTDGRRLYIVECKAGRLIKSDHIMKLQNIVRHFGGIEGRAILASCFPPDNKVVKKKIDDAYNIEPASGSIFFNQINAIIRKEVVRK